MHRLGLWYFIMFLCCVAFPNIENKIITVFFSPFKVHLGVIFPLFQDLQKYNWLFKRRILVRFEVGKVIFLFNLCAWHLVCLFMNISGVRLLRQDPVECLFSFICSSNNHISRIQGMVERLCQTLGTLLCKLDDVAYHDFPSLQDLTGSCSRIYSTAMLCLFWHPFSFSLDKQVWALF